MAGFVVMTMMAHLAAATAGAAPATEELAETRAWAAAKFEGIEQTQPEHARLEVVANNDPVQLNARGGKPLRIVDQELPGTLSASLYHSPED